MRPRDSVSTRLAIRRNFWGFPITTSLPMKMSGASSIRTFPAGPRGSLTQVNNAQPVPAYHMFVESSEARLLT